MGKIKPVAAKQGNQVKVSESTVTVPNHDHPIFCFRYLHRDYHLDDCNDDEKKNLIDQVVKLSQLSWTQIQLAPKHGMGAEKIAVSSLKAKHPRLTTDVSHVLALRFDGKKPMVGLRDKFIFHVMFIDRAFTLYSH